MVCGRFLRCCDTSIKPFEWTGLHQLSGSSPPAPCLPLKGSDHRLVSVTDALQMVVFPLAAGLGVVVDPDHLTSIRQRGRQPPRRIHGISETPVDSQAMASVGSFGLGASAARRSARLRRGCTGRISTPSATTLSSTVWTSRTLASLAMAAGRRTPRELPQRRRAWRGVGRPWRVER